MKQEANDSSTCGYCLPRLAHHPTFSAYHHHHQSLSIANQPPSVLYSALSCVDADQKWILFRLYHLIEYLPKESQPLLFLKYLSSEKRGSEMTLTHPVVP
jgi:hypothetical protein